MQRRLSFALLAGVAVSASVVSAQAQLRPTQLRCEYRVNPLGVDEPTPRLSWILESNRRGAKQTAYQIRAAASLADLKAGRGWDTGKVASDQSIQIPYAGPKLQPHQTIWWQARVWDEQGVVSGFSAPATWEMGLGEGAQWGAKWIALPPKVEQEDLTGARWIWFPEGNPLANAPQGNRYFRREVTVDGAKTVKEASLFIATDNQHKVWLNGKEVGSGGAWQALQRIALTDGLKPGANALAIEAYNADGPAGMLAYVQIAYTDGSTQRIVTDGTWKTTDMAAAGWETPAFDLSGWRNALVLGAVGIQPWGTPKQEAQTPPVVYLRRAVELPRPIRRARLYATALGLYEFRINGKRVGKDYFTPGWTEYKKRVQYQTYDVTRLLKPGANALGVLLGDGWFCGHVGLTGRRNYGQFPQASATLLVEYADGEKTLITTDERWKANTGAIRASDPLMGETYDARLETPGWDTATFDDSRWQPVQLVERAVYVEGRDPATQRPRNPSEATMTLTSSCADAVQKVMELRTKKITEVPKGAYVFDMGQNMVGWVRLKARGAAGTTVRLRFVEMLNPDGSVYTTNLRSARCTDYYTLKGGDTEIYEPTFTFHGFRYVEVTGYPGVPTKDALTGVVLTSLTQPSGTFECSNKMVNQLQSNIVWGQRGNYFEVPTDCPQRDERLGWMGDAQVFIRTACANFDVAAFMTKWVQDVRDAQSAQGAFPDVAPRIGAPGDGAPAWGDAGVIVPWTLYRVYHDTRLLERHYPAMQQWIAFIQEANPDLIWRKRSGNNYGDWLSINAETPREILATAYFAYSTRLVAQSAQALGKAEDAQKYEALFQQIRAAFNRDFVRPDGRILNKDGKGDTQTCYLIALRFDLLAESLRPVVAQRLADDILQRGGHLSTGFVGVGYLNPTLTQVGRLDLAYRLLNNDTFPSWGYSIKHGATTIWERWDGWTAEKGFQDPGMNSFNHYSLGSVGEWLYHTVAGIDLDPAIPAYKRLILRPRPGGGLTYAKASLDSMYGRIVSDWKIENGTFRWKARIPANTVATVYLPTRSVSSVLEGGAPISEASGVRFLRQEGDHAVYEVEAGTYDFTSDL